MMRWHVHDVEGALHPNSPLSFIGPKALALRQLMISVINGGT